MARAKKRRRLPTVIDRGLGLLEVILPHGQDDPVTTLPPGRRDPGGFWFPLAYTQPADIFTPAQRILQAKQRQVQRHRHKGGLVPPPLIPASDPTAAAEAIAPGSHAPSVADLSDRSVPLPTTHEIAACTENRPGSAAVLPAAARLPETARAITRAAVVDSLKTSD